LLSHVERDNLTQHQLIARTFKESDASGDPPEFDSGMLITRKRFDDFKEDELTTKVLIPLFRAMGFRDVTYYHGTAERGKDIVMWELNKVGVRTTIGVVVKATRISGRASGRGSAGEVCTQVRQCLNDPYVDRATGIEHRVNTCLVVCSREIGPEALKAIQSILGDLHRSVQLLHGDALWERVEEHLSLGAGIQQLQKLQEEISEATPGYAVGLSSSEHGTGIFIEPHDPNSPPPLKAEFLFPDTPEGNELRARFEAHFKTGAPVTIPKQYIAGISVAEPLKALLDKAVSNLGAVHLPPRSLPHALAIRLTISSESTTFELPYVQLEIAQTGTEQVLLCNSSQAVYWRLWLTIDFIRETLVIESKAGAGKPTIAQQIQLLEFHQALMRGGELTLTDINTGRPFARGELPSRERPESESIWLNILRKLHAVENRTDTTLSIPEGKLDKDDIQRIIMLEQIVDEGRIAHPITSITVPLGKTAAQNLLTNTTPNQPQALVLQNETAILLWGAEIPLGRLIRMVRAAYLTREEFERLKSFVKTGCGNTTFEATFNVPDGMELEFLYPDWIPANSTVFIPELPPIPPNS
jgi:hypothetical protein